MDKVTKFDKPTCRKISSSIEAAVQSVAQLYGIVISTGSGTLSDSTFTLKVECATKNEDGTINTLEARDFKLYCSSWDLEEDMLNKVFLDLGDGQRYRLIGAKPRSRKYPIIVVNVDSGKRYKFPASRVKRAFDAMAVEA